MLTIIEVGSGRIYYGRYQQHNEDGTSNIYTTHRLENGVWRHTGKPGKLRTGALSPENGAPESII